jgi:hypothetical protein
VLDKAVIRRISTSYDYLWTTALLRSENHMPESILSYAMSKH